MDKLFILAIIALCTQQTVAKSIQSIDGHVIEIIECTSTGHNIWEQQPHAANCRWFVSCMNNIGIVQQCPGELYFNSETLVCDDPENTSCVGGTTTTTTTEGTTTSETTVTVETTTTDDATTESTTATTIGDETSVDDSTTEISTTEVEITTSKEATTTENVTSETSTSGEQTTDSSTSPEETTTESGTSETTTSEEQSTDTTASPEETTTGNGTPETTTSEEQTTHITSSTEDQTLETTDITTTSSIPPEETTEENVTSETTDETTQATTELPDEDCEPLCANLSEDGGESPDPTSCNRFMSCIDRCSGAKHFCPENLHFNQLLSVCDLPSRAECILEVCADRDSEVIPSANSCRHFYACMASNALLQGCGTGLVFDPSTARCVMEDDTNRCQIEEIPEAPEEVQELCEPAVVEQLLRHPQYCDVYYRCVRGSLSARRCGEGLHFDELSGACNLRELAGCIV